MPEAPLTPEGFAAEAGVSRETSERLRTYAALLEKWQRTINLVSPATLPDLWRRHFLDSWQLLPLLPPGTRTVTDLGSGAGFPGLVLALCGDGLTVTLIESDARKAAFLAEAIRRTGAPAQVRRQRIEETPRPADAVTARACAPLPRLLAYARPHLAPGGTALFLKGRTWRAETAEAGIAPDTFPSRTDPQSRILRLPPNCFT